MTTTITIAIGPRHVYDVVNKGDTNKIVVRRKW